VNRDVAGHEADIVFVEEKVIVELDSWLFHWSRSSFEDERKRDTDTLLADHVTVRLTDERFDNEPAQVASDLHTILAERRKRAA
jgi:very-short-patch-repair endonuclease